MKEKRNLTPEEEEYMFYYRQNRQYEWRIKQAKIRSILVAVLVVISTPIWLMIGAGWFAALLIILAGYQVYRMFR